MSLFQQISEKRKSIYRILLYIFQNRKFKTILKKTLLYQIFSTTLTHPNVPEGKFKSFSIEMI